MTLKSLCMTQHLCSQSQEPHSNHSNVKGLPVCHMWFLALLRLMMDLPLTKRGPECHIAVSGFSRVNEVSKLPSSCAVAPASYASASPQACSAAQPCAVASLSPRLFAGGRNGFLMSPSLLLRTHRNTVTT